MVVGNGGLYEATITGIAAGTTIYFLSSFDDQLFSLTAGSDESEVRVIQFQKNGSSQDRVYMELAQGDSISHGELLEEMNYHFLAQDDDSVYVYNQDQTLFFLNGRRFAPVLNHRRARQKTNATIRFFLRSFEQSLKRKAYKGVCT